MIPALVFMGSLLRRNHFIVPLFGDRMESVCAMLHQFILYFFCSIKFAQDKHCKVSTGLHQIAE